MDHPVHEVLEDQSLITYKIIPLEKEEKKEEEGDIEVEEEHLHNTPPELQPNIGFKRKKQSNLESPTQHKKKIHTQNLEKITFCQNEVLEKPEFEEKEINCWESSLQHEQNIHTSQFEKNFEGSLSLQFQEMEFGDKKNNELNPIHFESQIMKLSDLKKPEIKKFIADNFELFFKFKGTNSWTCEKKNILFGANRIFYCHSKKIYSTLYFT